MINICAERVLDIYQDAVGIKKGSRFGEPFLISTVRPKTIFHSDVINFCVPGRQRIITNMVLIMGAGRNMEKRCTSNTL